MQHFTSNGVRFSRRGPKTPKGKQGQLTTEAGELTVLATGYRRPSLDFLPKSKAGSKYQSPNWYLQCFPTDDATICATNCTYREGIASVGGCQIGIYTRFLMVFLLDPRTKPSPGLMKAWVEVVQLLKKPSAGGPLNFVTSMEIFFWFFMLIAVQPALWQWAHFIIMGVDPITPTSTPTPTSMPKSAAPQTNCIAESLQDTAPHWLAEKPLIAAVS